MARLESFDACSPAAQEETGMIKIVAGYFGPRFGPSRNIPQAARSTWLYRSYPADELEA
jgi:hypothetical protein